MAEKQAHLNGAYYGPSIPPQKHYHRPGRRSSSCGCCCLIQLLFKILATIVILAALAGLIFWLIFRPVNKVRFYVTDVTLTQFNLTNSNSSMLNYDLALSVTVRNPNKKIGIYYDRIEVTGFYKGQRFGSEFFDPFYQGHKNTTILNPVLKGQKVVTLGSNELSEFNKETAAGVYDIDLKINLKIRFKLGKIKTPGWFKPRPEIKCGLKVPINGNGRLDGGAVANKCKLDYWVFG